MGRVVGGGGVGGFVRRKGIVEIVLLVVFVRLLSGGGRCLGAEVLDLVLVVFVRLLLLHRGDHPRLLEGSCFRVYGFGVRG